MLRKFSVENYKNFDSKITLDFTNVHDYKFNADCIKDKMLSKVLLVGKNASGKTNLAYALFDIVYTLTDNICNPLQKDNGSFINGMSGKKEATFVYEFMMGNDVVTYSYSKSSPMKIINESLAVNNELIFCFDYNKKENDMSNAKRIDADKLKIKFDGNISALRIIANNTVQKKDSPVKFIMDFANRMLYYRSCQDGNTFIGFFKNHTTLEQYIIQNGLVTDFQNFINKMTDMKIELGEFRGPSTQALIQKFANKELYFGMIASSGTIALELYYYWSKNYRNVSFLYIDEFDAYYHFELAKNIMKYTIDNVSGQVIFTSHNTMLTSNEIMRPDCCLKIENGKIISFADSTDRELREGHNIEKMYRNGAFDDRS